jgi:uncharacterized protein YkwD
LWKPVVLALLVALLALVAVTSGGAAPPSFPSLSWGPKFERAKWHNLTMLNSYRAKAGAPLLRVDATIGAFAYAGSQELMQDHKYHKHDTDAGSPYWECQGDNNGWPIVGWPNSPNLNATVDQVLASMMAEPLPPPANPGYNHHSIIIDPKHTKVGVGLVVDYKNGVLYLTNDFNP